MRKYKKHSGKNSLFHQGGQFLLYQIIAANKLCVRQSKRDEKERGGRERERETSWWEKLVSEIHTLQGRKN